MSCMTLETTGWHFGMIWMTPKTAAGHFKIVLINDSMTSWMTLSDWFGWPIDRLDDSFKWFGWPWKQLDDTLKCLDEPLKLKEDTLEWFGWLMDHLDNKMAYMKVDTLEWLKCSLKQVDQHFQMVWMTPRMAESHTLKWFKLWLTLWNSCLILWSLKESTLSSF